jgi:FkbM family methyltransferase
VIDEAPMNRESLALNVIGVSRRLFSHTRVHSWPVTGYLYRKVFGVVAPSGGDRTSVHLGATLSFPTEDSAIAPGLIAGYYERQELTLVQRLARVSRTLVDAGGNIGIYACVAGTVLPPGGRLVTFEPVPRNLTYLKRNIEQNGVQDVVTVVGCALGAESGEVTIHLAEGFTGSHSVSAQTVGAFSAGSITVPMTTIDTYLAEHDFGPVDVIKVDVEGFDVAVLRGAIKTIREDAPTLFVEYAPALLRNGGFEPTELVDIVFDCYEHVLMIDEPRHIVRPVERAELAAMADRRNLVNLVGVSRPEHLALCREPL